MKPTTPSAMLNTFLTRPTAALMAPEMTFKMVVKMPLMMSKTAANKLPTPFAISDMLVGLWIDGSSGGNRLLGSIRKWQGVSEANEIKKIRWHLAIYISFFTLLLRHNHHHLYHPPARGYSPSHRLLSYPVNHCLHVTSRSREALCPCFCGWKTSSYWSRGHRENRLPCGLCRQCEHGRYVKQQMRWCWEMPRGQRLSNRRYFH